MIGLALGLALALGLGHALARAVPGDRATRWALALPLGLGAASLLAWLAWNVGLHSTLALVVLEVAALAGLRRTLEAAPSTRAASPPCPRWLLATGAFAFLSALAVVVTHARYQEDGFWDAWSIWTYHARFLFRGGAAWRDGFATGLSFTRDDYPPLVPLAVARAWTFAGEESKAASIAVSLLVAAATLAVLGSAVRERRGSATGVAVAIALLSSERFLTYACGQAADLPLGLFVLVALVLLARGLDAPAASPRAFALAGFAAGLGAFTKNEGALFLGAIALSLGLTRRAALGPFALGAAAPLFALVHFKLALAPRNDLVAGQGSATLARLAPGRWAQVLVALAGELLRHTPFVVVVAGALAWGASRSTELARVGARALALVLGGFVVVYVTTPHDLAWHLDTSLGRLVLQLTPGALFVASERLDLAGPGEAVKRSPP